MVPSHLGNPIAENLDPRHGDSDIAPVLRQSFIFFSCSRHSSTLQAYSAPVLRGSAVSRKSLNHISSGRLGTPIGGHLDPRHGESDVVVVVVVVETKQEKEEASYIYKLPIDRPSGC